MSELEIYRKHAKQLLRWHREGNHSVGGRVRGLRRYRTLSDREVLALDFPLHLAQEVIASEAGYPTWADLKAAVAREGTIPPVTPHARLTRAVPVAFVRDVRNSAQFYRDALGFSIDFLHGEPPFYGSVSREGACLHLKFVHEPVLKVGREDQAAFISIFVDVDNVKRLFVEFMERGVAFDQKLQKEAWGGRDFIVHDPDGNALCFAESAA